MEIHKSRVSRKIRIAEVTLPFAWCGLLLWLIVTHSCRYPESSMEWTTGRASDVYAHGTDFVVKIAGDSCNAAYYLNRYLDGEKSLDSLKTLVLNKEVRMKYHLNYSILNPEGRSRPIDTLYVDNIVMYQVRR
jgi:hypothetical protein